MENPFETKESLILQSKAELETFLRAYGKIVPKDCWQAEVYPMALQYSLGLGTILEITDVEEVYNSVYNLIGEPLEEALIEEEAVLQSFIKKASTGTFELAKYLTKKYDIITVGEKEHEMFVYRDGVYFQAENEIIFPEIQRVLKHYVTKSY